MAHLWPLEAFLAHFGDARRPGCERVVQSACRDPVKRVASRARSLLGERVWRRRASGRVCPEGGGLWACGPGEEKEAGEETALGLVWGG